MHLFELPSLGLPCPDAAVPRWTLGCFRRRSITFFSGETDTETRVYWLQSRGLTADLRIYAGRPALSNARQLASCSPAELAALAEVEGGLAKTRWEEPIMRWDAWTSFQLHAKWPEPGLLRRVGDSLVEFAPSGAYVEDWRLQRSWPGPLLGLALLEEIDGDTGAVVHRGGGLVVCGRHAAFVRGRPEPMDDTAKLPEQAQTRAGNATALARLFSFEASYALAPAPDQPFVVAASTLPWREGEPLLSLEGFRYDAARGLVVQDLEEDGRRLERRFQIDTLEHEFEARTHTEVSERGQTWLSEEAPTLLRSARLSEHA
jgi:hypothetical protein